MEVGREDLIFFKNNWCGRSGIKRFRQNSEAWRLLFDHADETAEIIAAQHIKTQAHRDGLRGIALGTILGLRKVESTLPVPDWKGRFQEILNKADVHLDIDIPHDLTINMRVDRKSYYAQCIEYIRCAAYFVKTDLSEEACITKKAQHELLEALRIAEYLQCDLRDH